MNSGLKNTIFFKYLKKGKHLDNREKFIISKADAGFYRTEYFAKYPLLGLCMMKTIYFLRLTSD